jgi:PhnB protein
MQITPYLTFDGKCEEAFKFYEKCLGGKIVTMMRYGDSPMGKDVPPEGRQKIIHTTLTIGEQQLAGADAMAARYKQPQGFSVTLNIASIAEAERVFRELSDKGSVQMPIQKTFWAERFGMTIDRFGTPWMVNCDGSKS